MRRKQSRFDGAFSLSVIMILQTRELKEEEEEEFKKREKQEELSKQEAQSLF